MIASRSFSHHKIPGVLEYFAKIKDLIQVPVAAPMGAYPLCVVWYGSIKLLGFGLPMTCRLSPFEMFLLAFTDNL